MGTILVITLITASIFITLTVVKDRKDYFEHYEKKSN